MNEKKIVLKNYTEEELIPIIEGIGEKKFRAKQIYSWIMKNVSSFDEMNNLPKSLREKLKENFEIGNLEIELKRVSKKDPTSKYLFRLHDGEMIETVVMEYENRITICVSSQVGCRMGCNFCASTLDGLVRNLEAWEIFDQVLKAQYDTGKRISNIVMMGSGEPLDNYENMMGFMKLINYESGLNIGFRHITVSTCGVVPNMRRLADEQIPVNLALSLHSPFDEERRNIMPVAKKYTIKENIDACRYYIEKTNRRVTFEYSLIDGVNTSKEHAKALAGLVKGMLCHVNLIPVNNVDERGYKRPDKAYIYKFRDMLTELGVNATIRESMGADIDGACGQLRRKHKNEII